MGEVLDLESAQLLSCQEDFEEDVTVVTKKGLNSRDDEDMHHHLDDPSTISSSQSLALSHTPMYPYTIVFAMDMFTQGQMNQIHQ